MKHISTSTTIHYFLYLAEAEQYASRCNRPITKSDEPMLPYTISEYHYHITFERNALARMRARRKAKLLERQHERRIERKYTP